ncbi:MAG: TIGR02281 family clan AA aspartic protease [Sphingomonas sp.]|uniref:retropepsin-like aspartic protease family protein n=1 Tax=Sphingomonas sp. TaxID=28214 RepID=UPI0011F5E234|nr:TIGR02281 family clan AA aspartic protease [Sphingomonas sp.]THD35554.1 MAG: TIGR02281 family clan AA aspartic protease [Sphingomonas sp.]
MKFAFLAMTMLGIALGLLLPGGKPKAAPVALAVAAADQPRETVLERDDNGHFFTVADVNGEPIKFLVDTGATTVALTEDDARRAGVAFDRASYEDVARGAGNVLRGQRVQLKDVVLDGKRVGDVRAAVVEGLDVSLLGQNYLSHVDLSISGDKMTLK